MELFCRRNTAVSVRIFWEFLAACVGTMAFALLFQVPKRFYMLCGLIGGCGWVCYEILLIWCSVPIATFFANVVVVFLSRLFAVKKRCPVTVFLISGIFPLVPGAGIYWTAYYIVTNELEQAGQKGFLTLKVAVAIVLGILLVFELPQGVFRYLSGDRKNMRQQAG